jgi:hypothetical protein
MTDEFTSDLMKARPVPWVGTGLVTNIISTLVIYNSFIWIPNRFSYYIDKIEFTGVFRMVADGIFGKGNVFNWSLLVLFGALNSFDNYATAIGFQATEQPRMNFEGNPGFSYIIQGLVSQGFAKTESQALLYIDMLFWGSLLMWYVFGSLNSFAKLFLLMIGLGKVNAGAAWIYLPNQYGFKDILDLFAGLGKRTPERLFERDLMIFNLDRGYYLEANLAGLRAQGQLPPGYR